MLPAAAGGGVIVAALYATPTAVVTRFKKLMTPKR
jgi:hypothetical protein